MKKTTRFFSIVLSLAVLLSCAVPAFASENPKNDEKLSYMQNDFIQEDFKVIQLENGDRIEITTAISKARATAIRKSICSRYTNSAGEEVCSFTLFGDFDISTKVCVNAYHTVSTSGGSWRVEDVSVWHDTYTAYGSYAFVKRILGIKIDSLKETLTLNY